MYYKDDYNSSELSVNIRRFHWLYLFIKVSYLGTALNYFTGVTYRMYFAEQYLINENKNGLNNSSITGGKRGETSCFLHKSNKV